jgi:hypothetical protein
MQSPITAAEETRSFFTTGPSSDDHASTMETIVKYIFIILISLSPLGAVIALGYMRLARKYLNQNNIPRARYYRTIARGRFLTSILDLTIGYLGYYAITRRLFPSLEPIWLLLLVSLSGFAQIFIIKRAKMMRIE